MENQGGVIRFVEHDKLTRLLRASRYIPDVGDLRRAFHPSGVFVAPQDRYGLAEFLPSMFLGPPTLNRILALIPRQRKLVISGIALRPCSANVRLTNSRFLNVMKRHEGEYLDTDDQIRLGWIAGDLAREGKSLSGEITYDWSIYTSNPFEPERAAVRYEVRQAGSYLDVSVISDRDRDFFKLSEALEIVGTDDGAWDLVKVDRDRLPDTESRHRVLLDVTQQLREKRRFLPLGVARYEARRAGDLGRVAVDEFDRMHRTRQGEVSLSGLQTVMDNLKQRNAYMTMADMLFMYTEPDRTRMIARVEVYIKLQAKRLDISLVDNRVLGPVDHNEITTLDRYAHLERKHMPIEEEIGILRYLWRTIGPAVFNPLVTQLSLEI